MALSTGAKIGLGVLGLLVFLGFLLFALSMTGVIGGSDAPAPATGGAATGGAATTGGTTPQCQVGNWGDWSSCNTTCGTGTQTRSRTVTSQGNNCPPLTETQPCASYSGCSECAYGAWGEWTPCNSTCGNGEQHRTRSLLPGNNNPTCMSSGQDTRNCSDYSKCSSNQQGRQYAAQSRTEGQTCNSKFDCVAPDYHRCDNGVCEFYND